MNVEDAVLRVLADSDEPLHWTVIQDRALRGGSIDPFRTGDVRAAVLGALRTLVAEGRIRKTATGVYMRAG
jgi:hypothetical protein